MHWQKAGRSKYNVHLNTRIKQNGNKIQNHEITVHTHKRLIKIPRARVHEFSELIVAQSAARTSIYHETQLIPNPPPTMKTSPKTVLVAKKKKKERRNPATTYTTLKKKNCTLAASLFILSLFPISSQRVRYQLTRRAYVTHNALAQTAAGLIFAYYPFVFPRGARTRQCADNLVFPASITMRREPKLSLSLYNRAGRYATGAARFLCPLPAHCATVER